MNKVCSCADDCCVKTYYQYTDVIHLNYDDDHKVVNIYK